ncbi:MAG TPA: hypothetical protein PKK99_07445, partial [Bacteroidia bacterium]|nr:hypothetical protein [Bacteroidia bacterium]
MNLSSQAERTVLRIENTCIANATGTTNDGNHTKGKYAIILFGGPSVNTRKGNGVDKIATITMLSNKINPATFQAYNQNLDLSLPRFTATASINA